MTSAVSRIGTARIRIGSIERRDGRPGDAPARGEPERGQREADREAARVAHEDERAAVAAQVERQEADARGRAREREGEDEVAACTVTASIAKKPNAIAASVAARPSMLSSRLNAFVTPDEPDERDRVADPLVADELHLRPGREHDRRGGDLRGELGERVEAVEVVDEAARRRSARSRGRSRRAPRSARTRPRRRRARAPAVSPAKMPIPPSSGVGFSCQRSAEGTATSRRASGVRSSAQIAAAHAGRAAMAASVTGGEGSERR